ncbi:MAG: aspartate aminotransferase family protein [Actinomycetota bacterium]|nr:aspartate aminotransferase family protein [Actinomycetota bacterium]
MERARNSLPLGVPSSIQAYDPHPIVVRHAAGARMIDVDGNEYVDFDMGFGAMFSGHVHPAVRRAVDEQLSSGTLFVTPCELNAEVAELLADRYGLPLWRFTNSGTEATMDAIRIAKAATGRERIVKVEGGYHGHHDEVMVSMKPSLADVGPAGAPISVPGTAGLARHIIEGTGVVSFNDPEGLDRALAAKDVACFIVEPVMENIGIALPDPGYLDEVRQITSRHGTLLIFDEVKTGITAGYGGATAHYGVQPDLVTLAKSIGGGFPVGAFGGRQELMDLITTGKVAHYGTYNGNPLVMAACKATLTEACAPGPVDEAIARNGRLVAACQRIIDDCALPAHTVQFGAKGCITWSRDRVRNYRDYKATDFTLAYAQWIHGINRGALLPPGLDEQWLVSVMHTEDDAMHYANVFGEFASELTS